MLAPESRTLLLDALRPPPGTKLDRAIGATFTLDLETALTVPLAFAGYALSETPDPIAVMDAVRKCTDKLDVFCQAGGIGANRWPSELVGLLENVVHQVPRPRPGHLFHPKVWVVRYAGTGEHDTQYRCLVLSRNLTQDRSWDIVLRLDSDATKRHVNPGNENLARFVASLPSLGQMPPIGARTEALLAFSRELRHVWWQLPEDVNDITFWPFGLPGMRRPNTEDLFTGYRHLIVSPFITSDGIEITTGGRGAYSDLSIIGRSIELQKIPKQQLADAQLFAINPLACLPDRDTSSERSVPQQGMLDDLHAKLFVAETNRRARVFLGSANATQAAFSGNIELLCELQGGASRLGVECFLGPDSPLRSILDPVQIPEAPIRDEVEDLAHAIQDYLFDVAGLLLSVTARQIHTGSWTLLLTSALPIPKCGITGLTTFALDVAALNRPGETLQIAEGRRLEVEFRGRSPAELTAFFVIRCTASIDPVTATRSVVVVAKMTGAPDGRIDDIIVRQVNTPEKFMRLLELLLGFGDLFSPAHMRTSDGSGAAWYDGARGMFELLVRALADKPDALDSLDALLKRLANSANYEQIVPKGWNELWDALRQARTLIGREYE